MRHFVALAVLLPAAVGCAANPPVTHPEWQTANVFYGNPALLTVRDPEVAWETVVDVVDDYFKIQWEIPVQLAGNVPLEGQLVTFPAVGSTLFEPWRADSVGPYDKLESTLQSIRRQATVRVIPAPNGYLVDVAVFKYLEEVAQPMHATAGAATFRNDSSLTRVVSPVGEQPITQDWIDVGRDTALEQQLIGLMLARTAPPPDLWGPPAL
jgi:hypothetical protein